MSISFRSVVTVLAALTASSVAPAQVTEDTEPMVATDFGVLQVPAVIDLIDDEILATGDAVDPLAPLGDSDQANSDAADQPVKPAGDLTTLVAQFRSSDAGSRELECLAAGVYFE